MWELTIRYEDGRVVTHPLDKRTVCIGRDANCEVPLDDSLTSRRHALLTCDADGAYAIEDLNSKNGTTLNDADVKRAAVREGDRIGIGSCIITLQPSKQDGIILSEIETRFGSTSVWRSDQRFALPQHRLEKLYELNERLTGHFERDELLTVVLDVCMETLGFDRGGVAVWRGEPHAPQWIAMRTVRKDPSGEFRISRSIVQRALSRGERILVNDVASDWADPTASMISNNICSAMCVPLIYHNAVHGVLYGDRVVASAGYTKEDVDFFAALGRLAAMALANVRLLEEKQQRERMDIQLQWAREIQTRLAPEEPLTLGPLTIEALNHPGLKVSGDYFDYFLRPDGRIVVVIADVSGKGVPASLLMANLQAAVHVTLMEQADLARGAATLNRLICRNVDSGRFITGVLGLIEPAEGRMLYVAAGHPPPYLIGDDGDLEPLPCESNFPFGIEDNAEYPVFEMKLPSKPTTLFMYSDGVPDAESDRHESFGDARLREALKNHAGQPPRELLDRVRRTISQFTRNQPQNDDITMLAIRFA